MTATTPATEEHLLLHALVIKGFASTESISSVTRMPLERAQALLEDLRSQGLAQFREGRLTGWLPTPAAKNLHGELLGGPLGPTDHAHVHEVYERFSDLNGEFKSLCTRWQLLGGAEGDQVPNDHSDAAYDLAIIEELALLDEEAADLLEEMHVSLARLASYRQRLAEALAALQAGDRDKFTRPLYDSYHDIWMELHHDLILTLGLKRTAADS